METVKDVTKCVEILPNRLYFTVTNLQSLKRAKATKNTFYICFDEEFLYKNFFNDFGPLNISCLYKYSCHMTRLLQSFKGKKRIVHYTSHEPNKKSNAAYLIGAFSVVCLKMNPVEVYQSLLVNEPYKQFVDALQRTSIHTIRLYDCLTGIARALEHNLFDFSDFNVEEYDFYDSFKNGNVNWIIPRKFLAFLGPTDTREGLGHSASFYLEYFFKNDVKTVIRLNDKHYDSAVFSRVGIEHFDLFFNDGSSPSPEILLNFLRICETAPGAIAVHCKAGLGRTGTLIGAYLMKHYQMPAKEAIAWLRICRPGSVTGSQQVFLEQSEGWLWNAGFEYRLRHYGDESKVPKHKYGIYSKRWPLDRQILMTSKKSHYDDLEQAVDNKPYLKHVTKLLSAMKSMNDVDKFEKSKVLTVHVPKYDI